MSTPRSGLPASGRGRGTPNPLQPQAPSSPGAPLRRKDAPPTKPEPPKPPPQTLDDFVVKELLGKGAFGEVYLAKHKRSKKWMAMKQMDKALIIMQNKEMNIRSERKILCATRSDFMVKMHYSFQTKECLYIAMEYCSGGDLRQFLDGVGSLEEEDSALYFAEMITSVHQLHKMGYLHRDIKPENFLIDSRGHIKLADFGLSKMVGVEEENVDATPQNLPMSPEDLLSRRSRLSLLPGQDNRKVENNVEKMFRRTVKMTPGGQGSSPGTQATLPERSWQRRPSILERSGGRVVSINPSVVAAQNPKNGADKKSEVRRGHAFSVVGSPNYMSPEVTAGLNGDQPNEGYSMEVDWWSLGCVFWEMLLGVPPIQGDTPDEVFDCIANWSSILPALLEQYKAYMTPECFDLLTGFLCNRSKRRGSDLNYFKQHGFFQKNGVEWDQLHEMTPPFVPTAKNLDDDEE